MLGKEQYCRSEKPLLNLENKDVSSNMSSMLLFPDTLKHPRIISEIEQRKTLLYQELHQERSETFPSFEDCLSSLLKKSDYIYGLSEKIKSDLYKGKFHNIPERDRFFSNPKSFSSLKESFLDVFSKKIIDEIQPFLSLYQEEYRSSGLFSEFLIFLIKLLDELLSSLGREFESYVKEYCYSLLSEEKRLSLQKENAEFWSQVSSPEKNTLQEQHISDIFSRLDEEMKLSNADQYFEKAIIGILSLSGYRFLSLEKFKKQLRKCCLDTFSKKIFISALKKGNHYFLNQKRDRVYSIEIHKILGWRILVIINEENEFLIEGVYRDHDRYVERIDNY